MSEFKFGLEDRNWMILNSLVIEPLRNKGARLWVFGSRARGNHQKFSDFDLLVDIGNERFIEDERDAIEESTFPIKVDFTLLNELAESYKQSVMKDRIELLDDGTNR